MRILYLKEWGAQIDNSIHKILSKFGDEVIYPDINYQKNRNLIDYYTNLVYESPTLIVGSSMGAYFGHYVSYVSHSPSLLFNPTFFFKNGGELKPNIDTRQCKEKQYVFSLKDGEIDIKRTFKFLKEIKCPDENIKTYDSERISMDVFESEFSIFREKYKDFGLKRVESIDSDLQYKSESYKKIVPPDGLSDSFVLNASEPFLGISQTNSIQTKIKISKSRYAKTIDREFYGVDSSGSMASE